MNLNYWLYGFDKIMNMNTSKPDRDINSEDSLTTKINNMNDWMMYGNPTLMEHIIELKASEKLDLDKYLMLDRLKGFKE